ncbi:hypothetical protein A3C67_01310 [Candidatus Nomurabacteria bacterium RIFCSPHIGHO2_02_FULL_42_19]|uniref:DUF5667 domain-containing protein n=1 Tax=Candidatus Nomurabacteria bacterium RIFCSPHIGHO2_02_FULL_42_19 TaxID=1801756 RepID=A0A1F6W231_9BACT|nr:MAG: hypothetical protein A3C67_01310 [Candidatus Nomurabacteria bacterium RIFCSPHIGHO2_02_FULL_42_19]
MNLGLLALIENRNFMKKHLKPFVFLVVLGLMLSSPTARAEDNGDAEDNDGNNNSRPIFNQLIKTDREAFREKVKTERRDFVEKLKTDREKFRSEVRIKKEEFRSASKERKAEFRSRAREMLSQRFEVVVANLEKIQARVGEIIEKLKADGKDTEDAESYLDLSEQKLEAAKDKVAEIKALIPDTDEKVTPEVFEQIKLLAREAKDLLKESHSALRDAIKEIKDLRGEDNITN